MQIIQKNRFKDLNYNTNIDIFRGLSALLVLIYHLDIKIFGYKVMPNGYLGVDVFFTISGFLITDWIVKRNSKNEFSFKNFYLSRIKKLLPTTILVFLCISIAGWFFNFPFDYQYNALSIISFFKGDFNTFISSVNYGGTETLLKPTLHFWSLSTEIYFYIYFSIFFYFSLKFFKKKISIIFLIIIFIINIFFIYDTSFTSNENSDSYYFSSLRIFEFLVGSLFYLVFYKNDKKINNIFFDIILFLIISFFLIKYDSIDNHPNLYVIILLTSICFFFYSEIFNNKKNILLLLIIKFLKYIGTISYSLYLWHYPILSFSRINDYFNSYLGIFFTILLIFFISILTYEFFEKKLKVIKNKYFISLILSITIVLLIMNFLIVKNEGYKERFDYIKKEYKNYVLDNAFLNYKWRKYQLENKNHFTNNYKKNILIIGDSHSQDMFNIFNQNKILFNDYNFAQKDFYVLHEGEKLNYSNLENEKNFKKSDVIIISYKWSSRSAVIDQINEMIAFLRKHEKKIIFVSNTNEYLRSDRKFNNNNLTIIDYELLNKNYNLNLEKFLYENRYIHSKSKINFTVKDIAKKNNIKFLNKEDFLCDLSQKKCDFITPDGYKIYWDYGHYTLEGAKYFGEKIFKMKWFSIN